MAMPTVSSIAPASGHTTGQTSLTKDQGYSDPDAKHIHDQEIALPLQRDPAFFAGRLVLPPVHKYPKEEEQRPTTRWADSFTTYPLILKPLPLPKPKALGGKR